MTVSGFCILLLPRIGCILSSLLNFDTIPSGNLCSFQMHSCSETSQSHICHMLHWPFLNTAQSRTRGKHYVAVVLSRSRSLRSYSPRGNLRTAIWPSTQSRISQIHTFCIAHFSVCPGPNQPGTICRLSCSCPRLPERNL